MSPVEITIDEKMTDFMIRNILGHEPCHDFNPAGAGSRYVKLNKQLENVKIDGIYQEGGSGKGSGMKASIEYSVFSFGEDSDTIDIYEDMKYDSPSTVFNRIAKDDLDEDQLVTDDPENEYNIFYSILGNNYNSFLNEFDVDANNMDNRLALNTEPIDRATTRSMTQLRSNTINGIQNTSEMIDYIKMYMFNYISGYTSGVGLKSGGPHYGGKVSKPNNLMIEQIKEKNDGPLIPIENKKSIITKVDEDSKLQKDESELKERIQEGESELKEGIKEGESELKEGIEQTTTSKLPDRYPEYSYLNNALTYIIKEFDEYDKLDDDALIDVWPIDTDISRPYLKETKNIFVFYQYIFNYYINNINNILSSYLINDSYFISDAMFFFFINHFNSNEEKFLEITDEEKKKGILNEIFNLRIQKLSDDNKYLVSIKKNKKEEIVEKKIKEENIDIKKSPGQKGGNEDDEAILSLQIINMTTSLGSVIPDFNDVSKTVTIGGVIINNQDQLITVLQGVYGGLIEDLMGEISTEGRENYQVPADFDEMIEILQKQLIEEYISNTKSKSYIQQLKPKRGIGSLFTLINNYNTGTGRGRASTPENLKISINTAINTITTSIKARIIKLVSVVRYNRIKIQGSKTTSLSREAQVPVNMILQTVCNKVNDIIGDNITSSSADNNRLAQTNAASGKVFLTQKNIIDKIATGGSTSDVDSKLYEGFRNWLNNNQSELTQEVYDSVASWSPTSLKEFIQNGTKPIKVINNALSDKSGPNFSREKMIKVLSDYRTATNKDIFQIKCPISSIFDAQASFGSCNFGLDSSKSKLVKGKPVSSNRHNAEVVKNDMDIQITGTNNFLINLSLIFTAKGPTKGRAILEYTIIPGAKYTDSSGYKIITGRIESIIRDEAIDILSAQTVFKGVFNDITAELGNGSLYTYLTGDNAIHTIMSGLTQKFMGDFGQELNAIANNFGEGGRQNSFYTLLADGDRPSFVRASLLRLLAANGIDSKSYLWFMSPKGGVAVGPPESVKERSTTKGEREDIEETVFTGNKKKKEKVKK